MRIKEESSHGCKLRRERELATSSGLGGHEPSQNSGYFRFIQACRTQLNAYCQSSYGTGLSVAMTYSESLVYRCAEEGQGHVSDPICLRE